MVFNPDLIHHLLRVESKYMPTKVKIIYFYLIPNSIKLLRSMQRIPIVCGKGVACLRSVSAQKCAIS